MKGTERHSSGSGLNLEMSEDQLCQNARVQTMVRMEVHVFI